MSTPDDNKPNLFRRQFDDAQRQRLDVEGFWESSRGALTGVIIIGVIVVTAIAISVLRLVAG